MIYKLDSNKYNLIKPLVTGRKNIIFTSVIDGNNPGFIYVDDQDNPKTALIWANGIDGFYIVGEENNPRFNDGFNAFIDNVIKPKLLQMDIDFIEISSDTVELDRNIETLFSSRKLSKDYQFVYTYDINSSIIKTDVIKNTIYTISKIDEALFTSNTYENVDFVSNRIIKFWGSIEKYLDKGIGYCVLHRNQIISVCLSGFVTGNVHSIDIETLKNYRKLGLGKAITIQFLKEAKEKNLLPYWDCMDTNIASYTLAENVGFTKELQYPLYWFNF